MTTRVRVVLGLALLSLVNLAAIIGAQWVAHYLRPRGGWVEQVAVGFLFGGVLTLALGLTFGAGKWYWRLATCFVAILLTAFAVSWLDPSGANWPSFDEYEAWWNMLMLLWVLLIGFTTMWPWRRLRGVRLTWIDHPPDLLHSNQFHSRDLLFWMFAVAGVLAACRALNAIVPFVKDWAQHVAAIIGLILLATVSLHVAYSRGRVFLKGIALFALLFLVGVSYLVIAHLVQRYSDPPSLPGQLRLPPNFAGLLPEAVPFFGSTTLVLVNCLALRALGCRLMRRSGENRAAASAADFRG
jgi:hypothetical protein